MTKATASKCPVCSGKPQWLLQRQTKAIYRCDDCHHQYYVGELANEHVAQQYGDDYFKGGGTAGYADYLATGHLLVSHAERYAKLIAPILGNKVGTALDVGCAAGFIMQGFTNSGWQVSGIDPNKMMIETANQYHEGSAFQSTLEEAPQISNLGQFDLVLLLQVVAHVDDLTVSQRVLDQLVRPGGAVLVETWNSASFTAKILGRHWHEYSPPSALHYFSAASLDRFMYPIGMSRVASGRPDKRITIGHARSILEFSYQDSAIMRSMIKLTKPVPDRWWLPYPSEDLFWHLYRRDD